MIFIKRYLFVFDIVYFDSYGRSEKVSDGICKALRNPSFIIQITGQASLQPLDPFPALQGSAPTLVQVNDG